MNYMNTGGFNKIWFIIQYIWYGFNVLNYCARSNVQQHTFPMFKHVTFVEWCTYCTVITQSYHERLQCCHGLLRHRLRLFVGSKECPYRPE